MSNLVVFGIEIGQHILPLVAGLGKDRPRVERVPRARDKHDLGVRVGFHQALQIRFERHLQDILVAGHLLLDAALRVRVEWLIDIDKGSALLFFASLVCDSLASLRASR